MCSQCSCLCFDPAQNKTMRTFWCEWRNPRIVWDLSGLRRSSCCKSCQKQKFLWTGSKMHHTDDKQWKKNLEKRSYLLWTIYLYIIPKILAWSLQPLASLVDVSPPLDWFPSVVLLHLLVSLMSSLLSKHPLSSAPPHSPLLQTCCFPKLTPPAPSAANQSPEPARFVKRHHSSNNHQNLLLLKVLYTPHPCVQHLELRAHSYLHRFLLITLHTHSTARFLCPTRATLIYYSLYFMGQFINKAWGGFQKRFDLNPTCLLCSF